MKHLCARTTALACWVHEHTQMVPEYCATRRSFLLVSSRSGGEGFHKTLRRGRAGDTRGHGVKE